MDTLKHALNRSPSDQRAGWGLDLFSQEDRLQIWVVVLLSLFIVLLFGLRDLGILFFSKWPHLYGAAGVQMLRWEEIVCYLPFAKNFSWNNLAPLAPAIDSSLSGVSFLPPISMFLFSFIFRTIGLANPDLFLFIMHSFLPVVNFWLAYMIYRLFIQKSWAILIAFLGIHYFSGFSSAGYVLDLLTGSGTPIEMASLQPPEITRIPFPGISLALFSAAFYYTVRISRLNLQRTIVLSLCWGLQIYVYAFNFIAGAPFFALWLLYARYVTDRGWDYSRILKTAGVAGGVILVTVLPYIANTFLFQDEVAHQFSSRISWAFRSTDLYVSQWGIFLAYILPLGFVFIVIYLFRGDYYELMYKFTPVFIALLIDLIVGSSHIFLGKMVSPELYQHRISGILFRFFYFIPFLYFLQAPFKTSSRNQGHFHFWVSNTHGLLQKTFVRYRIVLCGLAMLLLGGIEVMGAIRTNYNHNENVAPFMRNVERQIKLVESERIPPGTVVFENIETNLALPALSDYTTLLVSSYSNYVDEEKVLERLALYARIYGWSQEEFLEFMLPKEDYRRLYHQQEVLTPALMKKGLGFWLLNHERQMSEVEIEVYHNSLSRLFQTLDLDASLKRQNVVAILSDEPISRDMKRTQDKWVGEYHLTLIEKH